MEEYQQRVVQEKTELDAKLTKLRRFFTTNSFDNLDAAERNRLFQQADAMGMYSAILGERINAFK